MLTQEPGSVECASKHTCFIQQSLGMQQAVLVVEVRIIRKTQRREINLTVKYEVVKYFNVVAYNDAICMATSNIAPAVPVALMTTPQLLGDLSMCGNANEYMHRRSVSGDE